MKPLTCPASGLPAAAGGAALLLLIVFLATVILPDSRGDGTYYTASRLLLQGRFGPQVYDDAWMRAEIEAATQGRVSDIFRPNPPTAALIALPVAWLPPDLARRLWAAINAVVLCGAFIAVGWPQRATPAGVSFWLFCVLFGLFAAPVVEGLQLGQAYVLLLGLYCLAWRGLRARRSAVAGFSLALALMLKTSGAPLWLLLAVRREWRALGWGLLGCLLLFGLSLPWVGLDVWRAYLVDVLPGAAATPSVAVTAFQSLAGFWAHLFRPDPNWNPAPLANLPGLAAPLALLSALAALGLTLARGRRSPLDPAFGAAAAASVFVVPFAEQHHYTLMVLPLCLAVAALGREPSWPAAGALLLAGLLVGLPLPYESPRLAGGAWALLAYPRLYGGLLLWGALLRFSMRPREVEQ